MKNSEDSSLNVSWIIIIIYCIIVFINCKCKRQVGIIENYSNKFAM